MNDTKAEMLAAFKVWWAGLSPAFHATADRQACYIAYIAGTMNGLDIAKREFTRETMP